ncbi:M48 family metallopeptidase [Bacteroides sp. Marseille-P3684]|uniref:M48 family metallopeptidase n=1 Tax=Bacteroides sp. Marseille-P3684 TaxID=2086579 RepID=UPI000D0ACEEC|nr:SprT family zinc-dependent metalloprotease [Bacteroides sp. Marseille-P3684]
MAELFKITDSEFGTVYIRINRRARRLILRIESNGHIIVTVPPGTLEARIRLFLDSCRTEVRQRLQQLRPSTFVDPDFRIDAPLFRFHVEYGGSKGFQMRSREGDFTLLCPPGTDFHDEGMQPWLRGIIQETLRRRAKEVLPPRIRRLSEQAGLPFQSVKINTSKGRWGSCSARRDINLSCSLVLLPEHLVDYVILHELCHTVEMNHSPRFWALLDKLVHGKSDALRTELKGYTTFNP